MSSECMGVVFRPRGCHELDVAVYNVATWHQLCGLEVEHEELGVGTVERSNYMSKDVWVRFGNSLREVDMGEVELLDGEFGVVDCEIPSYEF